MDEKTKEEPKVQEPETPTESNDEGSKPEADNLIEQSNKASERAENAAALMKKENDRAQEIAIKTQLAGKGQAGLPPTAPTISKEEQASQDRIMAVGRATGANWAKPKEDAPGMIK